MKNNCLEFIGTVEIHGIAKKEKFFVSEKFRENGLISRVGTNFRNLFGGKIEESIGGTALCYQDLRENLADEVIIKEIGGGEDVKACLEDVKTRLQEIYFLLEFQKIHNVKIFPDGKVTLFYAEDKNGIARSVWLNKNHKGYNVDAFSIDLIPWRYGSRVFHPNLKKTINEKVEAI